MRVDLYTIVWNDEAMLPFFFRHYDPVVDRYIVYDDGSSDRTLDILAAHDRVEVRPFTRTEPGSFVLSQRALYDSVWKESRGNADWVIITAVDEHLHYWSGLRRYLERVASKGVTAVPALAFQMVSESFPDSHETLVETRRHGEPCDKYNKLSVFNPDVITETGYRIGRHRAEPQGDVRYPKEDQLLLFHYKHLGMDYLARRYALLAGGLGPDDRSLKFGHHYDVSQAKLEAEFDRLLRAARDVTAGDFERVERKKWWRAKAPKPPWRRNFEKRLKPSAGAASPHAAGTGKRRKPPKQPAAMTAAERKSAKPVNRPKPSRPAAALPGKPLKRA